MANKCTTTVVIEGPRRDIYKIYFNLATSTTLYQFLKSTSAEPISSIVCDRARINEYDRPEQVDKDTDYILLEIGSAHILSNEVFKFLIKVLPSCKIYYFEEDRGLHLYRTSDTEATYFTSRYVRDTDRGIEYYDYLREVLADFKINKHLSFEEAQKYLKKRYNDCLYKVVEIKDL